MNTISSTLLWDVFTLVTNLTSKLESRDVVADAGSGNSVYIPVKKDKDAEETGIIEDLNEIIFTCNKTKPSKLKNKTVFLLSHNCENAVKVLSKNYPRKKNKALAYKKYFAMCKKHTKIKVFEFTKTWIIDFKNNNKDTTYCKHMATFLNQETFLDSEFINLNKPKLNKNQIAG